MHLKDLFENILHFIPHSYLIICLPCICKQFVVKNMGRSLLFTQQSFKIKHTKYVYNDWDCFSSRA